MLDRKMKIKSDWVLVLTREGMGHGERELQLKLITTYLKMTLENDDLPAAICFYTDGVKLTVEGSPVIDILEQLEQRGVRLILCSTCLDYYGLIDHIAVGITGGMADIIEAMARATKVISL
jgi:selenium metabolism protein YedF